jgi:hypothetical protein
MGLWGLLRLWRLWRVWRVWRRIGGAVDSVLVGKSNRIVWIKTNLFVQTLSFSNRSAGRSSSSVLFRICEHSTTHYTIILGPLTSVVVSPALVGCGSDNISTRITKKKKKKENRKQSLNRPWERILRPYLRPDFPGPTSIGQSTGHATLSRSVAAHLLRWEKGEGEETEEAERKENF